MMEIVLNDNTKLSLDDNGQVFTDSEKLQKEFEYDINKNKSNIIIKE